MELFLSCEVDRVATSKFVETERRVEPVILQVIGNTDLADLQVKIRYIPIIMNKEGRQLYPARSRLERKNSIFNCCPQLDIEVFLVGSEAERVQTFVNGLRECGPALKKLGASDAQVKEFDAILDRTIELASRDGI